MGSAVLIYVLTHWNVENKQATKYSELVCGLFYFVLGYITIIYLDVEGASSDTIRIVHTYLLIANIAVVIWLYPMNLLRDWYKCKKDPSLIENDPLTRKYDVFLERLQDIYSEHSRNHDVKKDLSRKLLHFIQFTTIILIYNYSINNEGNLPLGLTPGGFRNTLFIFIGLLFLFMFTSADLFRLNAFHCCPDWARKWFIQSLDPRSESWTFLSSTPFLQTMLLFILAPFPVLLAASVVSCIADSMASIIGKSMGRHKITNIGFFPNKSFEGLLAGVLTAFIGVIMVFHFYPMQNVTPLLVIALALIAALSFAVVDIWGIYIADNVLNTIVPGLLIWGTIILFT